MRGLVVLALVAVALGASASSSAQSAPDTFIKVSFWNDGSQGAPDDVWRLRCDPAAGTLPQPARACARLAAGGRKLFLPVSPDSVCTEIYGGPQRARVIGTVGGKRVWVNVTRVNGCHIDRWDGLAPWLLPPGGATG
jgi:hypothetical protein